MHLYNKQTNNCFLTSYIIFKCSIQLNFLKNHNHYHLRYLFMPSTDNQSSSCSISFNRPKKDQKTDQNLQNQGSDDNFKKNYQAKIYIKYTCPFCLKAMDLLKSNSVKFEAIDVAENPKLRQEASQSVGGYSTVPMVFIKDKFIGGCDQLEELIEKNKLSELL